MIPPCDMCKYKSRLWGVEYCLLDQWHGKENEKLCSEYTRVKDSIIQWGSNATNQTQK